MTEIWENIPRYEGLYQASNLGRIKSLSRLINSKANKPRLKRDMFLKGVRDKNNYLKVILNNNYQKQYIQVGRLILMAFHGMPIENKNECNHINGIKDDNRLENLEWVSSSENRFHAYKTGLLNPPHMRKVICITTGQSFRSLTDAGKSIGSGNSLIRQNCMGKIKTAKGMVFKYL